jgi:NitT/TauT family transport system permease protein
MAEIESSDAKEIAAETGGLTNWSALTSISFSKAQLPMILGIAVAVIAIWQLLFTLTKVPTYVMPRPSEIGKALVNIAPTIWPHILTTLRELLTGYLIGASIGIILAAVVTQFPFVEKIITPYILILITTPMVALVPLLMLKLGFGLSPRIVAVTLAVGPMVMINSSTGFRRTDAAKLALARVYGANTLQSFAKVRVPLAMPMILVGLMVGGIFGLLTAVGAEMVGGSSGLGNRLMYYSALARMDSFFAVLVCVAVIGLSLYVFFYWVGKKLTSWQE